MATESKTGIFLEKIEREVFRWPALSSSKTWRKGQTCFYFPLFILDKEIYEQI